MSALGSLADIEIVITHVCFASKSGHVHNQNECLLSAINGHLESKARSFGCTLKTLTSGLVNPLLIARLDMNKVRH